MSFLKSIALSLIFSAGHFMSIQAASADDAVATASTVSFRLITSEQKIALEAAIEHELTPARKKNVLIRELTRFGLLPEGSFSGVSIQQRFTSRVPLDDILHFLGIATHIGSNENEILLDEPLLVEGEIDRTVVSQRVHPGAWASSVTPSCELKNGSHNGTIREKKDQFLRKALASNQSFRPSDFDLTQPGIKLVINEMQGAHYEDVVARLLELGFCPKPQK